MAMYALINCRIFDGEKIYADKALVVEGMHIQDVIDQKRFFQENPVVEKYDLGGELLAPGFIDLQLNGCGGVLFNDDISEKTLKVMNETNHKFGCTSFLPTLITSSDENILNAIKLLKNIEEPEDIGVLGLHLEGPSISVEKKGIHSVEHIRKLSKKIASEIQDAGNRIVKIITMAPENSEPNLVKKFSEQGIRVSIGHTNATYEQGKQAVSTGFSMATHLFNAMSQFNSREPGVVGAIFESGEVHTGIIVDGVHSHYASVKIAKSILGEKLFLVTDAVSPVGTDMEYFFFEGKKVYYRDGKCISADGTLGGSGLTMIQGVKNLVEKVEIPLEEALRMASLYPAAAIGLDDKYGKIKKEYMADIVVLDDNLNIKQVFAKGKKVY